MSELQETVGDILPPSPIRVETALSRYPVHRLAKHGDIAIDIQETNENGVASIKWEVNYVGKFGQPGPLAYKLDTLVINRRIEEAARPIPRVIRLGSLKEIAAQLELGGDTNLVKKALRQNASTFIIARIDYKRPDGSKKKLEADFNRYSVVFTGEELPDGRKADAVYIVLSDIYMQVINGAMTRPLDYDYLKRLAPAAQRFYELLSFQMYATIKNDRPRAKLLYSEFCTYAPQTRYPKFDQVKKQMYKIHFEHRKSGYIAKIDYEQTTDTDGQPDWIMLYQPGPKARADYRAFTRRGGPMTIEVEPIRAVPPSPVAAKQAVLPLPEPEPSPLVAELARRGVTAAIAADLVHEHGEERIRLQIDILDATPAKKRDKIDDPAAYLVTAIRNGHAAPKGFIPAAERKRQEEARQAKERANAEKRRREQVAESRQQEEQAAADRYWASLTPAQQKQLDADALADGGEDARQTFETMKSIRGGSGYLKILRRDYLIKLMRKGKLPPAEAQARKRD